MDDYFQEAIDLAKKSVIEKGKINPFVGAVALNDKGVKIATAYRGECKPGEHGEFTILEREEKLKKVSVAGGTLFVTLEPCSVRGKGKIPCAKRIVDRKIKKVFIGMLDPNDKIQGHGVRLLRDAGIEVQMFPDKYAKQVEDLNRNFIRYQYKQNNLRILSHENGDIVNREEEVMGIVNNIPAGTNFVCCVSLDNKNFYPQHKMRKRQSWFSKSFFGIASSIGKEFFFIVGFAKKETDERFRSYNRVHKEIGKWIPISLDLEKEFEHYVRIQVKRL